MIAALLLGAALSAHAAPAAAGASPSAHPHPYWTKTYSFAPYQETWTLEVKVKKLDDSLGLVVQAVEKNGGKLTMPVKNFVRALDEQQLSASVPAKKAKALLAALKKLGEVPAPAVRPAGAPLPLAEIREKLNALTKERTENSVAFSQTPAAAEAVDEIIEHLANVEAVAKTAEGAILWNITVREKR